MFPSSCLIGAFPLYFLFYQQFRYVLEVGKDSILNTSLSVTSNYWFEPTARGSVAP